MSTSYVIMEFFEEKTSTFPVQTTIASRDKKKIWLAIRGLQYVTEENQETIHFFFKRVVFWDECKFSSFWFVNKQNYQVWDSKRPNEIYQRPNNNPFGIVWCVISKQKKLHYFF